MEKGRAFFLIDVCVFGPNNAGKSFALKGPWTLVFFLYLGFRQFSPYIYQLQEFPAFFFQILRNGYFYMTITERKNLSAKELSLFARKF